MSGYFLYYMPGRAMVSFDSLASVPGGQELRSVLPKVGYTCVQSPNGPEGFSQGCVFTCVPPHVKESLGLEKKTAYAPKEQTWLSAGDYAVGYWNDAPPTPEELVRGAGFVSGYPVDLNGQEWIVPLARAADGSCGQLPQSIGVKPNGEMVLEPLERYAQLAVYAQDTFETIMQATVADESPGVDYKAAFDIAIECLKVNYYVGRFELALLKAFTTENVGQVMAYLADLPGLTKMLIAEEEAKNMTAPVEMAAV